MPLEVLFAPRSPPWSDFSFEMTPNVLCYRSTTPGSWADTNLSTFFNRDIAVFVEAIAPQHTGQHSYVKDISSFLIRTDSPLLDMRTNKKL